MTIKSMNSLEMSSFGDFFTKYNELMDFIRYLYNK